MRVSLISPPVAEPLSLDSAKEYLRVTHEHEDELISSQIKAARLACERITRRSFITRVQEATFNLPTPRPASFGPIVFNDPDGIIKEARLPGRPVKAIQSVFLNSGKYGAENVPLLPEFYALSGNSLHWPKESIITKFTTSPAGTLIVRYEAGESVEDFEDQFSDLLEAIRITLANIYENRGMPSVIIPPAAMQLLAPHCTPLYR